MRLRTLAVARLHPFRQLVRAFAPPTTHAEEVADHPHGYGADTHGRLAVPGDAHWDLGQRESVALDEVQHLDVEGEPVETGVLEDRPRHIGAERLAAALRVAVLRK